MKPIQAVEAFIKKIQKDYADDVSLLIIMGSTIYNDTHSRSDVDMFYVPKTEKGYNLAFTCIIDDIGYDFWGLSWERLTRIANHEERIASAITEGQVLYCASEEDRARWDALKAKALDVRNRKHFIDIAEDVMKKSCADVVAVEASDTLRDVRYHSISVIYAIGQTLSLLNGVTVKRGRGKLKGELLAMPKKPQQLENLYDTIFFSEDIAAIKAAVLLLFTEAGQLVITEKKTYTPPASFKDNWRELYEELINAYNKIAHACEVADPVTALFAATELIHEMEAVSAFTEVDIRLLPDLIATYNPKDLSLFEKVAEEHKAALEMLLHENGVSVRRFANFIELQTYLERL